MCVWILNPRAASIRSRVKTDGGALGTFRETPTGEGYLKPLHLLGDGSGRLGVEAGSGPDCEEAEREERAEITEEC